VAMPVPPGCGADEAGAPAGASGSRRFPAAHPLTPLPGRSFAGTLL
jgi:hypothetical protein